MADRVPSLSCWRPQDRVRVILLILTLFGILPWTGLCNTSRDRSVDGPVRGAEKFRGYLVDLAKTVTGTGIYATKFKAHMRSEDEMRQLLLDTQEKMEKILRDKEEAVLKLKEAAEKAMENYGPYKEVIDFKDVKYYNAKKVVIDTDFSNLDSNQSQQEVKAAISYLPTKPTWTFRPPDFRPLLNSNVSSIHVPTNIYDKSMKILNGVQWTNNLTETMIANAENDSNLAWQYFCSSDGFFRLHPGMKWPRNADEVDVFDCRIRKWYIQAATAPKNILILLDSSGSMKGLRFSIARSTVSKILDTLSDEDYFNVIEFSDEPRYVDECFNKTLVPASVDNIQRMQSKIEDISASNYANFKGALIAAFQLFQKEQLEYPEHYLCNKAIMIITDGAPDNFESVFSTFNWPNKTIRVFTFLIGKEVPDNRQTRWMSCVNKGEFAHISTRADVQENVQKYIKVLSRPLALAKYKHRIWTPVYLDYVTEKSQIKVAKTSPQPLDITNEGEAKYEGLSLVMSMAMPVFDNRQTVGSKEEEPERNLLGVVGTDLRIKELMKHLPTYQLGVNGYAFAITNHGYVLFHPDYRPFYIEYSEGRYQVLKAKPKYNSVELSEVELPQPLSRKGVRLKQALYTKHPLRDYLLSLDSGSDKMQARTVLTHNDYMRRAKIRSNQYRYLEVGNIFRLVFVVPDKYGVYILSNNRTRESEVPALLDDMVLTTSDLSKWVYCSKNGVFVEMRMLEFSQMAENESLLKTCSDNVQHMQRILDDISISLLYVRVWTGVKYKNSDLIYSEHLKAYSDCFGEESAAGNEKLMCFLNAHASHGILYIWLSTGSGFRRYFSPRMDKRPDLKFETDTKTLNDVFYKRAVDGMEEGFKFVFTGETFDENGTIIMTTAETVMATTPDGQQQPVPAAVTGFRMEYQKFYAKFVNATFRCEEGDPMCFYTCNDTDRFECYIVDDNGYILANNIPDSNGTGSFLGQVNGRLMKALLEEEIYKRFTLTDYQELCSDPRDDSDNSSSSGRQRNPLQALVRLFFWLMSEFILFLSEWNILSYFKKPLSVFGMEQLDVVECGDWIEDSLARYLYCNFAVYEDSGTRPGIQTVKVRRSCEQTVKRFALDKEALLKRRRRNTLPSCADQCASKHQISYEVRWLNDTNLIFIVADSSCSCEGSDESKDDNKHLVDIRPVEMKFPDEYKCQMLLKYSQELKHVDSTRQLTASTSVCLDSSYENDTESDCMSRAIVHTPTSFLFSCVLTVLSVFTVSCLH